MSRYLRLLRILWGTTLATELEYRVNFWSNAALSVFWLIWAALGARVYFRFGPSIRGWRYEELLVVMGLFFAMNGIRQTVIQPNLARMSEYIRMGTLDFVLTKPIDSQFLVSLRHVGVYNWLDPVLGAGLVGIALFRRGEAVSVLSLGGFLLLGAAGVVVMYSVSLALQCLTIWAVGSEGVDDLVQGMVEAGRFPVQMYRGLVRALLTFAVPVAFLTTFPAEGLLGRASPSLIAVALGVAALLLFASSLLWRFSLRHYTGASA